MNNQRVLVTGGTGFVGIHTVLQLLTQGYFVNTTLRSFSKKDTVINALKDGGISDLSRLAFFEAELTDDKGWADAVNGCDYVLHIASPFPASNPEIEDELIIPARDGALRVLKAAKEAGVKRVVLTSSFAAVGYSIDAEGHVFSEEDWTDLNLPLPAYIKSKTVAEKAAWDFIAAEGNGLELSVINPVGIFGPALGGITSASLDIAIIGIINGSTSQSGEFTMGVVDVRDVADLHIKAMTSPVAAGERFLANADGVMSFYDVAELIRAERPAISSKVARMQQTPERFYKQMSNHKARTALNWKPRSREEAILASVDSYIPCSFLSLTSITSNKLKVNNIQSCHLGPEISPEIVIQEHYFLYLLKGSMKAYDGNKNYELHPGDYCLARKNYLVRYTKFKDEGAFEKIIITLDEPFLRNFLEKHAYAVQTSKSQDAYLSIPENRLLKNFIQSLEPYYSGEMQLDETFANVKREELLLILLKADPELANIFFNFGIPHKIDLETYMNRNFRFNVSLDRFAYLTGRSLSSFKRDFMQTFGTSPGQWLKKKRLDEAYFQINHHHQRPSDVYLEVGFEDLSHFSFAFKKEFGINPSEVRPI